VAEVLIDKSKNTPEFKLKCNFKKENENPQEPAYHYRTPYLVVREFNKVGNFSGYPLSKTIFM
jgi:hypothetical protein